MSILKEVLVKFVKHYQLTIQIEESRKGREMSLDLKIGILHSYPNSDLQFENYDSIQSDKNADRQQAKVR